MAFISWLRNSERFDVSQRRRIQGPSRQRSTFRPQLEALEDRWMPSILTVTTAADSVTVAIPGSLRYEIGSAQNRDTIVFDSGLKGKTIVLQNPNLEFGANVELMIDKNLTIQGCNDAQLAISSQYSRALEVFAGAQVTISDLTFKNSVGGPGLFYDVTAQNGGAILNRGNLTLDNGIVTGNSTLSRFAQGGGIYNDFSATMTLNNSTVSNNKVGTHEEGDFGGGIFNAGTMTVSGGTVSGNYAFTGGGIFNAATMTVSGCTVSGNSAYQGGGIFNNGTMTITACTVSANSASYGGGVYNDHEFISQGGTGGTLTVNGCTVSLNSAAKAAASTSCSGP
jgi:hypothetical protein